MRCGDYEYEKIDGGVCLTKFCGISRPLIVIPESIKGNPVIKLCETFIGIKFIKEVVLPNSLKTIGINTFVSCTNLKKINLVESNVTKIGDYAFMCCSHLSLKNLLESKVEDIGNYAFRRCSELNAGDITPSDFRNLGKDVFWDCGGTNFTLSKGNNGEQGTCGIIKKKSKPVKKCKSVFYIGDKGHIPDEKLYEYVVINGGVCLTKYIGIAKKHIKIPEFINGLPVIELRGTFKNNTTLKKVSLPGNLLVIGMEAFLSCISLVSIDLISSNVTTVGMEAFSNCVLLKLGDLAYSKVTVIRTKAFYGCKVLIIGDISRISLNYLAKDAFDGCGRAFFGNTGHLGDKGTTPQLSNSHKCENCKYLYIRCLDEFYFNICKKQKLKIKPEDVKKDNKCQVFKQIQPIYGNSWADVNEVE